MNFVTKNLGWILLLLFFLFMLFVISSNDSGKTGMQNAASGSILELSGTGETQENLDNLVKMIDESEESIEKTEEELISTEALIGTGMTQKKGFFSFLNWGKGKKKEGYISDEVIIEEEKTEDIKDIKEIDEELNIDPIESPINSEWGIMGDQLPSTDEQIQDEIIDEKDTKEGIPEVSEEVTQEGDEEDKMQKQSFFSKIFGKKSEEENIDSDNADVDSDLGTGVLSTGSVIVEKIQVIEDAVIPRAELIGMASEKQSASPKQNIIKKTDKLQNIAYADIRKYAPEVLNESKVYPGLHLDTQVGKEFEVGVYSLKLNNKYFTEKLGYMMKGDIVKQLTRENRYGCFEVEVLHSVLNNEGKKGYVCKKYLQEAEGKQGEGFVSTRFIEGIEVQEEINNVVHTQIGDLIMIEKDGVILGDIILEVGNLIDQMSDGDTQGCFIAHVYQSYTPDHMGRVGKVCNSDLY